MNLFRSPMETTSFFFMPCLVSMQGKASPDGPFKLKPEGRRRYVTIRINITLTQKRDELRPGRKLRDSL